MVHLPGLQFYFVLALLFNVAVSDGIHRECRAAGMIAFTYDQGPSIYTGQLLTALSQANAKASFHIVPEYLDNPVISANLRRAASDGHIVGLFIKGNIKMEDLVPYIQRSSLTIKKYTGYEPRFLRFAVPGPSPEALKQVQGLGYFVTGFNLDSRDYELASYPAGPDGAGPIHHVIKSNLDMIAPPTMGSFIVVQSDLVPASVGQTAAILKLAKEKGYRMVRLDECIGAKAEERGGKVANDGTNKQAIGHVEDDEHVEGSGINLTSSNSSSEKHPKVVWELWAMVAMLALTFL